MRDWLAGHSLTADATGYMIYSRIGFLLLARSGPPRRTSLNAPTRFGCNPHSGRRHDNRHYRPRFKAPFAGLQQCGGGARTVRKGRSATRHLGYPACPRGLASRCLCRARLRPCAGPALADGSAAAPGHRALRAMGRKIERWPAMCWPGRSTPRAPRGAISRCSTTTPRQCSKPMRAASTRSSGRARWPAEYAILGARPAAWEPWHSIAVMRQIGFLMGSVWWKLWRAAALPIVGADNIETAFR